MLTVVSIASTRTAIKHLTHLGTISRLADGWAREIRERYFWAADIEQECSVQFFSALRSSFLGLLDETSREYLTVAEFHSLLQRSGGSLWQDAMSCVAKRGLSLQDVLSICIALREVIYQELREAEKNGLDQYYLLTQLFDWVLAQAYPVFEGKRQIPDGEKSFNALEIDELKAIVESARSPVDLKPVFKLIVDRVSTSGIWPMCAIGIIDTDTQEINVPAYSGFADGYPRDIKFPTSGSATLETIRRNQPVAITDAFSNVEFPVIKEAAIAAGYRSILLVPLTIEELQAVVTFASPEPHEFSEEEVLLANAIAQQVMIAIETARHYEREKQRVENLEYLNEIIAEQNRLLQRAAATHTAFTRLVLDNAGLESILNAVRDLLGNPVAIENEYFQLLGYTDDRKTFDRHRLASIAAGGTAPELFSNQEMAGMLEDLRRNRRPLLIPKLPAIGIDKRRIVAPITAGGDILGYVWVMESLRTFEEQDLIAVEQASLVFALEMMKQRASYETELRLKADFMGDLLSQNQEKETDLLQRASFLGYNFDNPSLLLLLDIEGIDWEKLSRDRARQRNRQLVIKVQETVTEMCEENLVTSLAGRIVAIVPVPKTRIDGWAYAKTLAADIRSELKIINPVIKVTIGVGEVCNSILDIRRAYLQAGRAVDAAKSLDRFDETLKLTELGIYGVLFREEESSELQAFAEKSLVPLIEYDRQNNTDLLGTLDAYLMHQSKLSKTARQLYIHVNTLRQRLERIEDVLGVRLDDPFIRLNLQVALRIHEIGSNG